MIYLKIIRHPKEYGADFENIASYFDYPTTFKAPIGNTILKDKEELIKFYKVARSAEVVGDDYWYSCYWGKKLKKYKDK